jgi:hypothetical protein
MATPSRMILLDVVQAVGRYTTSDEEVVAVVAHLINSGRVLLCGTFAGARIDLSVPTAAAPPSVTSIHGLTPAMTTSRSCLRHIK